VKRYARPAPHVHEGKPLPTDASVESAIVRIEAAYEFWRNRVAFEDAAFPSATLDHHMVEWPEFAAIGVRILGTSPAYWTDDELCGVYLLAAMPDALFGPAPARLPGLCDGPTVDDCSASMWTITERRLLQRTTALRNIRVAGFAGYANHDGRLFWR